MKKVALSLVVMIYTQTPVFAAFKDILDPAVWKQNIQEQIDRTNIDFSVGISEGAIIAGLPLGIQYDYDVGPSYKPHSYNRIDKYDINVDVNIGSMLKVISDTPLSFGISRHQSFFFVRQFPLKIDAIKATPYSPNRLPLTAKRALDKLDVGDFVSIPANLSLAIGAGISSNIVTPLIINVGANAYWVISGEFNIQIYKLDDKHVRLKMITTRAYGHGTNANGGASFSVLGVGYFAGPLTNQLERLFDRDMLQLGMSVTPGAQFILDYIFDLSDPAAADAYNEILNSSFKFKDLLVLKNFGEDKEIKNKLFSTYEKADHIFLEDSKLPAQSQRVNRLFKGFTNSSARSKHLKLGLFLTSYTKDKTFSRNDLTFTDEHEKDTEFWYPTYNHYSRSMLGNYLWGYEDVQSLTCFGLLPKNNDLSGQKIPEIGINFDRTDAIFTPHEQRKLKRKINSQVPASLMKKIDWNDWLSLHNKHSSRISFKFIINSDAYSYMKEYSEIELQKKYLEYAIAKNINHFNLDYYSQKIASKIYNILQNKNGNAESAIKELIDLNKSSLFEESGIGFLASLLPEEKLEELLYLKIEMLALDEKTIKLEFGTIKHEMLYQELAEIQSKIANRSFDLRVPNLTHP